MGAPSEHFCDLKWSPTRPISGLDGNWQKLDPNYYETDSSDKEFVPAENWIPLCWAALQPGQPLPTASSGLKEEALLIWGKSAVDAIAWTPKFDRIRCETLMRQGKVVHDVTWQNFADNKLSDVDKMKMIPLGRWFYGGIVLVESPNKFLFFGTRHSISHVFGKGETKNEVVLHYHYGSIVKETVLNSSKDPKPESNQWTYLGICIFKDKGADTLHVRPNYCVSKTDSGSDLQDWYPKEDPKQDTELNFNKVRFGLGCFAAAGNTESVTGHFARFHLWKAGETK